MPIDKNGKLYLDCQKNISGYFKVETFADSNGNTCTREIEIPASSVDTPIYDIPWTTTLEFWEISKKEIYLPIKNSISFKKSSALILSKYLVDVGKNPCSKCNDKKMTCRIRVMPSGVYRRHFSENGDSTISYFLSTNQLQSGAYTLLSESVITPKEAKRLLENNQANCLDLNLRRDLGLKYI
jgi:hypothetical protein